MSENIASQTLASAGSTGSAPVEIPITCEACKAEGVVENPAPMERVSCPCGALYLYWPDGRKYGAKSPWKCVVKPIFANTEEEEPNVGSELPREIIYDNTKH